MENKIILTKFLFAKFNLRNLESTGTMNTKKQPMVEIPIKF